MCTICFATQTFDPNRHQDFDLTEFVTGTASDPSDSGAASAAISELADAAADSSTTYVMEAGDSFIGTLSGLGDEDWIAIEMTAGVQYTFDLNGSVMDPIIEIYDSSEGYETGFLQGVDDFNASGSFTAGVSGTYYIAISDYADANTGSYIMSVTASAPPPPPGTVGTYDQMSDYLTEGFWGGTEFKWDTSTSNVITVDISDLTAAGQQLAMWAMDAWEAVADLQFSIVTSGAMIKCDDEAAGAYAYAPGGSDPDGTVLNVNKFWDGGSSTIDSYGFQTYVHEFGHALGLGHMGPYDGFASYSDPSDVQFTNDSWQLSVMSYFNQVDNTTTNASFGYTAGPMMVDILAIQELYGAATTGSITSGDTTYGLNSNVGNYMDQLFSWLSTGTTTSNVSGNSMAFTVFDADGVDTFDMSFLTVDANFDMNDEQFSDFGTQLGVLGIARDTMIENALVGSGNDTVTGNEMANSIFGNGGSDTLFGQAGNDTLDGGAGGDFIHGDEGNDTIFGEFGNDTLYGGQGNDRIDGQGNSDRAYGGEGNDVLIGDQGFDLMYGDEGNDTLYGGSNADRLYGGDGDDFLRGGSTFSVTVDGLYGGAGNDSVFGDGGFDYLDGGDGNDYLDGGHQADNVFGGEGNDTMYGDLGLDRLFGGNGNDIGYGGDGNDGLFGGFGNDTLYGDAGDDRFFGASGNDTIFGGEGNDTINGGSGFDTIDGGTGDDMIFGRFNADRFVFSDNHGNDTIGDFAALNDFEKIDLSDISAISALTDLQLGNATSGAATQVGSDVIIDTGGGNSITLTGVNLTDLDANDFVF